MQITASLCTPQPLCWTIRTALGRNYGSNVHLRSIHTILTWPQPELTRPPNLTGLAQDSFSTVMLAHAHVNKGYACHTAAPAPNKRAHKRTTLLRLFQPKKVMLTYIGSGATSKGPGFYIYARIVLLSVVSLSIAAVMPRTSKQRSNDACTW